jgi:hypothetical protein
MVTILGRRRLAGADYLTGLIAELQASGVKSPSAIAAALNERLIPTPRGRGVWGRWMVRRFLARPKV